MDHKKEGKFDVKLKLSSKFKQNLKIPTTPRLTPWSCPAEFDYVGRCFSHATILFTDHMPGSNGVHALGVEDNNCPTVPRTVTAETATTAADATNTYTSEQVILQDLQYAIQRVSLWKTRVENGRLPHSVDMTCSLAQILLQDATLNVMSQTQPSTGIFHLYNNNSIKLSYATIIIRAVNGIADSMQRNRAKYGASVSSLCSQIGLPLWIVDLRHDSAHNELPSLVALRLAANTLMGFFLQRYWTAAGDLRINWKAHGENLLKECKSSCKELDRLQSPAATGASNDDDQNRLVLDTDNCNKNEKSNKQLMDNENVGIYGMYSVLVMESNKKKSNNLKHKTSSEKIKLRDRIDGRTPRQCLQEYIDTIPMDVGVEMLVQYLFQGGISDAPQGRGILIPGSLVTFPETIDSARKMRERYSVILIFVTENWPGFLHTAITTIAEMIILQDMKYSSAEAICNQSCDDYGSDRKKFFLKHWFKYLLSNEFFCHLQWIDITWNGSRNIRDRPREKWSEDLMFFLESCAPIDALRQARLPLRSIYNRFISEGCGPVSSEIASYLEDLLGIEGEAKISPISDLNPQTLPCCSLESKNSALNLTSWSSCEDWEACNIGMLPGHI